MVNKRFVRIPVELEAELVLDLDKIRCEGIIENLSEEGLHVRTVPSKTTIDFSPGKRLELNFKLPSGETLNLLCKVKWTNKTSANDLTSRLGLEIIEPSMTYEEFFKTSYIDYMGIL